MSGLFEDHFGLVAKVLDMRLERQNVVMANIANVNTPRYKPRRVLFEKDLQDALQLNNHGRLTRTDPRHMPAEFDVDGFNAKDIAEYKPRTVYGEDNVDLDKEMEKLAKNSLMYNALSEVLSKNFSQLQSVIQEGSK